MSTFDKVLHDIKTYRPKTYPVEKHSVLAPKVKPVTIDPAFQRSLDELMAPVKRTTKRATAVVSAALDHVKDRSDAVEQELFSRSPNPALRALLLDVGDDGCAVSDLTDEARNVLRLADRLGLAKTLQPNSAKAHVELTQDGQKALAIITQTANTKSRKTNDSTINAPTQENPVSKPKTAQADKAKTKTAKPAKVHGPTYGLPFRRTSVPSARWLVTDALVTADSKLTAEAMAKKLAPTFAKELDKSYEETLADVRAVAIWLNKHNVKHQGLAKPEPKAKVAPKAKVKAKAPAPKASKPKVKKAAPAADKPSDAEADAITG